jgi:hypothetical protein
MYEDLVNSIKAYTELPITIRVSKQSTKIISLASEISEISKTALKDFLGVWFNSIADKEVITLKLTEECILLESYNTVSKNKVYNKTTFEELYTEQELKELKCPLNIKGYLEPFNLVNGPDFLVCNFDGGGDSGDWNFPNGDWTEVNSWSNYQIKDLEERLEKLALLLEILLPDFNGDEWKQGTILFNLKNYTVQIHTTTSGQTETNYYSSVDYARRTRRSILYYTPDIVKPFSQILDTTYLVLYNNYIYQASTFGIRVRSTYIAPPIKKTLYLQTEVYGDTSTKSINYTEIEGFKCNNNVQSLNSQVLALAQAWATTLKEDQLVVITTQLEKYNTVKIPYCWNMHTKVPSDITPPNYKVRKANWFGSLLTGKTEDQLYTVAMILAEIKYFDRRVTG